MKKLLLAAFLVTALVLGMASTALAYDSAEGCTVDANGDAWLWGGTVTCRQTFQPYILVGQGPLDANGCFDVFVGNGHEVDCVIDYNPGPAGDPANGSCLVPTDTSYLPYGWPCGTIDTGTGPNAVALSGFAGSAATSASTLVLALTAALGGVTAWLRRR